MDERDKLFELERFEIRRDSSSDINEEEDTKVREVFRKLLLVLGREKTIFDYDNYDRITNNTGYTWFVLKGQELETAINLLKDILGWERKHGDCCIAGNLYKGDYIVIGRGKCLIRCDESCMPLKGTDANERIKKICEENEIMLFSDIDLFDLFTGQKYRVDVETYPGMVDDAATNAYIGLMKIEGRVLDLEAENNCEELKFKWRFFHHMRFVYKKAYGDDEIKNELIRLEKIIGEELIKEYNFAISSSDNDVKHLLKRNLKKENESDYFDYDELSDGTKETMIYTVTSDNMKISFSLEQKEILADMNDNVERTPGFTMVSLLDSLENDENLDSFRNDKWKLVFRIPNGSETCLSQWENLILKLYPWIEKVMYREKDKNTSETLVITRPVPANPATDIKQPVKNTTSGDKNSVFDNRSNIEKMALIVIFVIFGIVLFLLLFGCFFGMKL